MVAVEGDYWQPSDGSCSCNDPGEGTWVGLGDGEGGDPDTAGRLLQAGTGINATYTNGNKPQYAGFYEWFSPSDVGSNGAIELANLGLSAGNQIFVSVSYDQSTQQADFYVADNTTGNWGPSAAVDVSSQFYDGSTADWEFERTRCPPQDQDCGNYSNGEGGLGLQNLANIGTGRFYTGGGPGAQTELADGSWETLGTLNSDGDVSKTYVSEVLQGSFEPGSTMLSTSTIHSDGESFAVTWNLCE
jgi:hypothetical protein